MTKKVRRRRNHGLTRLTEQDRAEIPHAGRGGSRGYPVGNRRIEIARPQAGLETTAHEISLSKNYRHNRNESNNSNETTTKHQHKHGDGSLIVDRLL